MINWADRSIRCSFGGLKRVWRGLPRLRVIRSARIYLVVTLSIVLLALFVVSRLSRVESRTIPVPGDRGNALAASPDAVTQFVQQGPKLVGSGAVGNIVGQGWSVSLSADGNTALVGAPYDNLYGGYGIGAGWIWTRSGGVWTDGPKLVASDTIPTFETGVAQGYSVSLSADGNTAIIGGPGDNHRGAAWVFAKSGGVWTQQGNKLLASDVLGVFAKEGSSVSISADGNTAVIGGWRDNEFVGAAWVWTRSAGGWTQRAKLVGEGAVDNAFQGESVAISADGNTVIVGGPFDQRSSTGAGPVGAAWIWTRNGGVWTPGPKLVGSGAVGNARQGSSVSLSADGNTAIVGGPNDDNLGFSGAVGAAWIWTRAGGVWNQQAKLTDGSSRASQGRSVSLSADGNTAVIGGESDSGYAGAAWVWRRSGGGVWALQGPKLVGSGAVGNNVQQGWSVSLSGDGSTAIVGGPGDSPTGAAWVFTASASPCVGGPHGSAYADTALVPRDGPNGAMGVALNEPLGNRTPVILIHGIHGNRKNNSDTVSNLNVKYFENLIRYLNSGGSAYNSAFKTYSFHYVSDRHTTQEIAKALRDRIDETCEFGDKPVIIVAHSMGGIVARQYMLQATNRGTYAGQQAGVRVQKLITLATPHHGTYGSNGGSRGRRFLLGPFSLANTVFGALDILYWNENGCGSCIFNPQHPNRVSLLWDNNNSLPVHLDLDASEQPTDMPDTSAYNNKIIAYHGEISADNPYWQLVKERAGGLPGPVAVIDQCRDGSEDLKLACASYFIDSIRQGKFNVWSIPPPRNDGLVPIESARFDGAQVMDRIHCAGYNHLQMEVGTGWGWLCGDGKILFKSVRERVMGTSAGSPPLLVGPDRTGFGSQTYGIARPAGSSPIRTLDVELLNLGDAPLQITSLILAGENPDQFAIVNPPPLPLMIGAESSVHITVGFNPTSPGEKTAELRAENSSSNSIVIVNLSATGLPQACDINFSPSSQFMPTGGGNGQVMVGNISCPWTVLAVDDWIHPTALADRVSFTVDANPAAEVRYGTIIVSVYGRSYLYSISQDAANSTCWLNLSSDQSVMGTGSGSSNFYITTPTTCNWSFQSDSPWLVPAQPTLQGSGQIGFSVTANFGAVRSAKITIQGQSASAEYIVHQRAWAPTRADFDGDGRSDFAVFRPSEGVWYVLKSESETAEQFQFGQNGDVPLDVDLDGDLKADYAVWRPSTGKWFYRKSSDGTFGGAVWGTNGDKPVPADYDGDGKTDIAVWRPTDGLNYIVKSSGGFLGVQWGTVGDIPSHADLNGDGKTDFAVFRPSTGTWFTLINGTSTTEQLQFGTNGDTPVRGDIDGDQKGDIIVWRPSTGEWFYRRSSNLTFGGLQWGANGDRPVPGDYDGDGKTDYAVWRPTDGTNYIVKNSGGFLGVVWGTNGDIPILAAPLP